MRLELDNEAVHGAMDQIPMQDMSRFVDAAMKTQATDPALRPGLSEIIGAIQPEAGLFVLEQDEEPLATAICVHDGDLAGLFEVATAARRARQGPRPAPAALRTEMGEAARRAARLAAGRGRQFRGTAALRNARLQRTLPLSLPPWAGNLTLDAGVKRLLLVAAVALVDADGRVLLAQRPEGKTLAGLWEFPGGKVEPGETPEETIVREVHEEIGVETKVACLAPLTFASHSYEDFHLLMPLYVCRRFWGIPEPREGQTLKWVRPRNMRDYPMPPADLPLIPHLIDLL